MGTTVLNYYLFPAPEKKELVSGVKRCFKSQGYVAASKDEGSDVQVELCITKGNDTYLSVVADYYSDPGVLAKALAETFVRDVLGASIYDSDVLELYYCNNATAEMCKAYIGVSPDDIDTRSNNIKELFPLLKNADDSEKLHQIWEAEYVFQEDRLSEMLKLFGNYEHPEQHDENAQKLYFRKKGNKDLGYTIVKEGKPKFICHLPRFHIENSVQCISAFRNIGGPSKGISVVLKGELVDKLSNDLSAFSNLCLEAFINPSPLCSNDNEPDIYTLISELSARTEPSGALVLVAHFPDFEIPEGLAFDLDGHYYQSSSLSKHFHQYYGIYIRITVKAEDPKSLEGASFYIIVAPHENWKEGQACHAMKFIEEFKPGRW